MDLDRFRELPLLGILRGIGPNDVVPVAEAVAAAGLRALEVTMNTDGAPDLIRRMVLAAAGRFSVGAGTVLNLDELAAARAAGASFVVSPTLVPAVVEICVAEGVPVFPGALTPGEVFEVWSAGATMVKVFPASCFGPSYFAELAGPFRGVPLLACGGVSAENMRAYFECGASAAAFGGSVFRRDWLAAGAYDRVREEVAKLVAACASAVRRQP